MTVRSTICIELRTSVSVTNSSTSILEDDATLSQGYAQLRTRLTEEFTVNAGLHAQYYTLGDAVAVEPRAGIVWSVSPTMSLHAGYGLHSQAQNIYVYNVQEPDSSGALVQVISTLAFTRSHHAVRLDTTGSSAMTSVFVSRPTINGSSTCPLRERHQVFRPSIPVQVCSE
ncbi:MAG: TonB-dependent receptor [Ignavibacteria bacterium]|nr:TonB-dependent receptor [Ignavibacteria bacterium]